MKRPLPLPKIVLTFDEAYAPAPDQVSAITGAVEQDRLVLRSPLFAGAIRFSRDDVTAINLLFDLSSERNIL